MESIIIPLVLGILNSIGIGYIIWYLANGSRSVKNQVAVDTSGLIDGRIVDIVRSGFVPQRIIVPKFVIAELQLLADQSDAFKRERARFGLEVVRKLQDLRQSEVVIAGTDALPKTREVDAKLVALAKRYGAMLYTTDFNLNQVAQIEGVQVLNVNELAQGLRAVYLPGETTEIKITQTGQDKTQGVGYLEDGTMVVVDKAAKLMNKKVRVTFSRILQTQAGKMMFATLHGEHHKSDHHKSLPSQPSVTQNKVATQQNSNRQRGNRSRRQPKPQHHDSDLSY